MPRVDVVTTQRGQATLEFSLVVGFVLLMILGAIQTGLYAIERGNAASATESGVLTAVSAQGSPAGGPATSAVFNAIAPQLRQGLFGAKPQSQAAVGGTCPSLAKTSPIGVVYVCSTFDQATSTVTVSVRGWVPALVPPGFGIAGNSWALPIDIHQLAHVATFAP